MTYAICRDYEDSESFPYLDREHGLKYIINQKCLYYPCTDTKYECWMPDEIEDDEFNLVILLHGQPVKVRGIHFDFIND